MGMRQSAGMSQHLRVLYVDYSLGFGGAVKSLSLMLRALPGVEKFVFTSQDPEIIEAWFSGLRVFSFRRLINYRTTERLTNRLQHKPIQRVMWKMMAAADLVSTAANFLRLLLFIKRNSIDIVHLNNGFIPQEALLAAAAARVPCVVHLRDFHLDSERLRYGAAHGVAKVITISDAVGASLNRSAIPESARTTIHNPVDLELMDQPKTTRDRVRDACGLANDDVAVGIFGRVIPWKGQLEFVRALLLAMDANSSLRALIVGDESDGDEAYFRQVRETIGASPVAERFILTGYRKNVEEYYAAMDIVVHASVTPEPFGRVIPEAMAAGRAVIAADAGGPRELIDHGIDGVLTPPGDVDALSRAVLTLASNRTLRDSMAAAGKKKAAARFGAVAQARQVAAVYQEVLAPQRTVE
jgi:glycosyltransferase involved in cell wall biosynthesis